MKATDLKFRQYDTSRIGDVLVEIYAAVNAPAVLKIRITTFITDYSGRTVKIRENESRVLYYVAGKIYKKYSNFADVLERATRNIKEYLKENMLSDQ